MNRRHAVLLCSAICVFLIASAFWKNNPPAWRKTFAQKVAQAVPLGSTKADFDRAAEAGQLGDLIVMDMEGKKIVYVIWRPINAKRFDFDVTAEPILDAQDHITAYEITSCAHFFSERPIFHYPP